MHFPPTQPHRRRVAWVAILRQLTPVVLGAALLLTSCVQRGSKSTKITATPTKPVVRARPAPAPRTIERIPAAPEQRLGTVRVIGAHGSFVLVETPSAAVTAAVPTGYLLHCRPQGNVVGSSTADLRVSPERRQPFLVADVLNGLPTVGDVVYLARDSAAPSPPPGPAIPYSSVLSAAPPPPPPEPTP